MLQPIYEWLWPLFEVCNGTPGFGLRFYAPFEVNDQWGNLLYSSNGAPVAQSVCLCPTPMMNALLLLAMVGLIAGVFGLAGMLVEMLKPPKREPDPVLQRFIEHLDQASAEYLKRS